MTKEQAAAILIEKYPGKMHYVSCHQWSMNGRDVDAPRFAVCVYDVLPEANATGNGKTIREAVEQAIMNDPREQSTPASDADAMFADPAAACV